MACPVQNTTNTTASARGYIYDTLLKIDQLQKAATLQTACEGCEDSLISNFFNTKPISIYFCCGTQFAAEVPESAQTTTLFRVESIRNDSVVLRLLVRQGNEIICTNYTIIVKIDCICSLQCFAPICCEECTKTCGNA